MIWYNLLKYKLFHFNRCEARFGEAIEKHLPAPKPQGRAEQIGRGTRAE